MICVVHCGYGKSVRFDEKVKEHQGWVANHLQAGNSGRPDPENEE